VGVVGLVLAAAVTAYIAYTRLLPAAPPTLAVFRDIAARGREDYARAMAEMSHGRAMRDMLGYNHLVARLAAAKFRLVGRSLACLRAAIMLWMLLLLAMAVGG
jgi:hypothetical protein